MVQIEVLSSLIIEFLSLWNWGISDRCSKSALQCLGSRPSVAASVAGGVDDRSALFEKFQLNPSTTFRKSTHREGSVVGYIYFMCKRATSFDRAIASTRFFARNNMLMMSTHVCGLGLF